MDQITKRFGVIPDKLAVIDHRLGPVPHDDIAFFGFDASGNNRAHQIGKPLARSGMIGLSRKNITQLIQGPHFIPASQKIGGQYPQFTGIGTQTDGDFQMFKPGIAAARLDINPGQSQMRRGIKIINQQCPPERIKCKLTQTKIKQNMPQNAQPRRLAWQTVNQLTQTRADLGGKVNLPRDCDVRCLRNLCLRRHCQMPRSRQKPGTIVTLA